MIPKYDPEIPAYVVRIKRGNYWTPWEVFHDYEEAKNYVASRQMRGYKIIIIKEQLVWENDA